MKRTLLALSLLVLVSCTKEEIVQGERIVQVIPKSLDPRFETYYGWAISLEALATQNYNPDYYNFSFISDCKAIADPKDGSERVYPTLEDIALMKYPLSQFELKAKCRN